ncbi:MAG: discoidin domain-containing protein [Chthoniobacteraceae bacterium]
MPRLLLLPVLAAVAFAQDPAFPPQPPVQPLSAAESLKKAQLPPGYRLELVLSEPQIAEPVAISFDGDGRMFVVEMRTYMQDINGTGEHEPISRVSLHEDTDGDGRYDKHTVFADKLLLPRMVLPLERGRALIGETDTNDINLWTDADGDGVAEKKEKWFEGGPRGGNMEHQPSGLIWSTDNWLYTTYNSYRLRWTPAGVLKEPTAPNGGQWGVSQDDWAKQWFVNAGGEKGPVNFQTPIVYGAFNVKDQFAPGYDVVWPLVGIPDVQGGERRSRPEDKTLNHFTATSGGEIYRGDRLPAEVRGDLFFGEPVGRLMRRTKIELRDGLTYLSNPHQEGEFLRSTDPLFRPMQMANAPDGTLYVVDMYRGIIQEGNWTREGSYLRKIILQYGLDKPVGMGRIWRLVHDTTKREAAPKMSTQTPAQLVAHLAHPNGWWRDTAQKLLVLKQDASVVPALMEMARSHKEPLARLHALWTLEGLDALTPELVREKLKDAQPQLRAAAIRVGETLYKKDDKSLVPDVQAMVKDADANVVVQAILTAKRLEFPEWKKSLEALVAASPMPAVKEIGGQILRPAVSAPKFTMSRDETKLFKAGQDIYQTLCAACHGLDGKGMPMLGAAPGAMLAPPLAGSKTVLGWRDGAAHVMLQGLVGDIDGKKYEGQMIPMANNDDAWIAGVLSYVRNSFGNRATFVSPQDIARIRSASKDRTQPWTIAEVRAALPRPLADRKAWKLTASHAPKDTALAVDGKADTRYTTKATQVPGMWLQIELPAETTINGLELDAAKSPNDYPRGYTVELSIDGKKWSPPAATGAGLAANTVIQFAPAKAKFIRVTQTGSVKGLYWSIHELQVFTPTKG